MSRKHVGVEDLIYYDQQNTIVLPVDVNGQQSKILFRLNRYSYMIVVHESVMLNFMDGEEYNDDEIAGDIELMVQTVKDLKLKLIEKRLFGMRAYIPLGLDSRRFAQTKHFTEAIVGIFGRKIGTYTVKRINSK
jgi:hypothetical protein